MTNPTSTPPSSIFKTIDGEEFQDRYDLHKIVAGIPGHLFLIIGSTILFSLIGVVGMWHYLHNYRAESFLVFQADETKTLPGGIPLTNINLATAVDMVAIPSNLQALKSMLGLDTSVKELQEKLDVSPPRINSNLIKITAFQSNPNLAIDMANTLARISVKGSQDYYKDQLKIALYNYRDQLETANEALSKQLKQIEDFKTQHHYFEMDNKNSLVLARLADLRNKLQDATLQYNGLLVEYENLKREVDRMSEQQFPSNMSEPGIGIRYNALESALVDARMKYSKDNPRLKALEDEMKSLRQSLGGNLPMDTSSVEDNGETMPMRDRMQLDLMRLQGRVRSAQKMKEELTNSLDQLSKEMENLPNQQVAFSRLLQDKQILDDQVSFLNNSIDLTQLLLNNPRGSLGLYQLADKAYPLKDAWWVKILPLLAGLFGFLTGLALAFLEEMRDPYFRTPKQLNMSYDIPCIGVIPEISTMTKRNTEAKTLFYIRHLVEKAEKKEASLKFPAGHPISIALMSCSKGEGKSLLSHHMALYYMRLGRKVLLMEFDPTGESFVKEGDMKGTIAQYLKGQKSYQDILIPGKPDTMKVGIEDPELKELIKSQRMRDLWLQANKDYQVIIIDTPGLIDDVYAANLAAMCDMNIFVVGSSTSSKELIDTALKELEFQHSLPSGIALNQVPPRYIFDQRVIGEMDKQPNRILNKILFWN